ncbi:hypothetical protein CDL15_Pgr020248 [Punica granatum]|nr:hypothetical protein CDL15_Pgr020248 [Punica granatum]
MPRLRLYVTFDMIPHVERWVDLALDYRVEELIVEILHNYLDKYQCPVPARVFSANFIKSLTLDGGIKVDGISAVRLPSLRSLQLWSANINEEMFRRLIGGCPVLEDLSVFCCYPLSEIEVSNLNYLKRARLGTGLPDFKFVRIKAPGLERFEFWYNAAVEQSAGLVVEVLCRTLTCLKLTSIHKSDEWFCHFLSKFPLLESLTLDGFGSLKRIRISNPLLKKISIESCYHLEDLRIDTPKLLSFYYNIYYGLGDRTLPFIWTENTPYSSAVGFRISFSWDPPELWLEGLQKFLTGWSATFRCLESTVCLCESGERIEEDKKNLASAAPGIQYMNFTSKASQSINFLILDCLFRTCQPRSVVLRVPYPLVKLICEAFAAKVGYPDYPDCCSGAGGFFCFCHRLKDAKIEWVEGYHHGGPLDWSTMCSLLRIEVWIRAEWWD